MQKVDKNSSKMLQLEIAPIKCKRTHQSEQNVSASSYSPKNLFSSFLQNMVATNISVTVIKILLLDILSLFLGLSGQGNSDPILDPSLPNLNYHLIGNSVKFFTKCTTEKTVALTYDDGPVPVETPKLLDILKQSNVKATFFVLGSLLENDQGKAILKRAHNEGHTIASHSYSHASFPSLSSDKIEEEMSKTSNLIYNAINIRPTYFRPPYGDMDEKVAQKVQDLGYTLVHWNFDTLDWQSKDKEKVIDVVKKINDTGKSYIVLKHDIHQTTIEAQPEVIKHFQSLGYQFVNMDECLGTATNNSNLNSSKTNSSEPVENIRSFGGASIETVKPKELTNKLKKCKHH